MVFRTNNVERARFGADGRYGINSNDQTFAQFFSYSNLAAVNAIVGYSDIAGGTGVYGRSIGGSSTGLLATNDNANGWGAYGINTNTTSGVGTVGQSRGTGGTGVVGLANGTSYSTLVGYAQGVAGTGQVGVYGMSTGTVAAQRYGGYFSYDMDNDLSTSDSNSPIAILAGRSNNFLGAIATNNVYFGGNFSGGNSNTSTTPVTGPATTGTGTTADFAYVGARWGSTNYKILGNGTVSTIIDGEGENQHIMFAPEAPEMLFQDYGIGKLVNGKAQINIDPILAKNIVVNEKHPLKVFIQLEGDCNGVYVSEKSAKGFVVKELQNGNNNVNFSYQIVATRADRTDKNGNVLSKNADVRLPIAPKAIEPIKTTVHTTKKVEVKKIETEK